MAPQGEVVAIEEVPDTDGGVDASTDEDMGVIRQGNDTFRVPFKGPNTLACPPVPNSEGPVHAPRDQFEFVKLKGANRTRMSAQTPDLGARVHIPNAYGMIVGTGDEYRIWQICEVFCKLHAHYAVLMTM